MEESEVLRVAQYLVRRHGVDATLEATMRLQELVEEGDMEGSQVWIRIIAAIGQVLRTQLNEDESSH